MERLLVPAAVSCVLGKVAAASDRAARCWCCRCLEVVATSCGDVFAWWSRWCWWWSIGCDWGGVSDKRSAVARWVWCALLLFLLNCWPPMFQISILYLAWSNLPPPLLGIAAVAVALREVMAFFGTPSMGGVASWFGGTVFNFCEVMASLVGFKGSRIALGLSCHCLCGS